MTYRDMHPDPESVLSTLPVWARPYFVRVGRDGVPYNWAESQGMGPDDFPSFGPEDVRCHGCDFPTRVCGPLTLVEVTIVATGEKRRHMACQADIIWWRGDGSMLVDHVRYVG